ncbi:MAG: FHA domain-containing protein [Candidatus Nanopelagicales bacterium]|nr:FHA domain-containing protein [Candidatus Nanopelagicales bacterium]MDP4906508.1 FHA domain-containing protein [Candidatus Nanopelagicales bacterium]
MDVDDRFCRVCGAEVVTDVTSVGLGGPASTGSLPAVGSGLAAGVGAGEAVLVVRRGMNEGVSYLLTGDVVTAGREPDSDLFLDDVTVSRRHADMRRMADGWLLRDVGSLNGTYVNRQRIEEVALVAGDEVQIGKYRFVYLVGGATGSPS